MKNENTYYLITGGCGFIGVNLVKYILQRKPDAKIRILDNLSVGSREILSEICDFAEIQSTNSLLNSQSFQVELIVGDIRDYDTCLRATKGVLAVIHLAAQAGVIPSIEDPFNDCKVNIIGTLNLLKSSIENNVDRFIFASSNAPLGEQSPPVSENKIPKPLSPYGASKLAGEAYCSAFYASYGLKTIIFRFSNVYGPYSLHKNSVVAKFIKDGLLHGKLTIYGDGTQTRDFIHVRDLCSAIYLLLISQSSSLNSNNIWGEVFHLGTGIETRIIDLAQLVKELFDRKIDIVFESERKGEIKRNYSDISKIQTILGFKPEIKLEDGIREVYEWFCSLPIEKIRNAKILSSSE